MLHPAPGDHQTATRELEQIEREIRQKEDELEDAEAKQSEFQLRGAMQDRVESLRRDLRRLLLEQQQMKQQAERAELRANMASTRSPIAVPPEFREEAVCSEEARVQEVHGADRRTTFINRRDSLRLRITSSKRPGDVCDYFDKGRADCLHTYVRSQHKAGTDETVTYFAGREDKVQGYSRKIEQVGDDIRSVHTIEYGHDGAVVDGLPVRVSKRVVRMRPGRSFDVTSRPPSALKEEIASVAETFLLCPEATCRVARYTKDRTQGLVTSQLWAMKDWDERAQQSHSTIDGGPDASEVHRFALGADGRLDHCKDAGKTAASEEALAAEFEALLQCEASTLRTLLAFERALARFATAHRCGDDGGDDLPTYMDSIHERLALANTLADSLFRAVDSLDSSAVTGGRKGDSYDAMAERYESKIASLEQVIRDLQRKGTQG